MAKNQTWTTASTTLENGRVRVYDLGKYKDGEYNKLSTVTQSNPGGRVDVNSDSSNEIVKGLQYSVNRLGYIAYYYKDEIYTSIDELKNEGIVGYNTNVETQIKNSMQFNLQDSAVKAEIPGAALPDKTTNNDGSTDGSTDNDTDLGGSVIGIEIPGPENIPTGGFRYPESIGSDPGKNLDIIKFTQGAYVGTQISGTFNLSRAALEKRLFKFDYDSVYLGIQPSIIDNNTVEWNGSKLNELQAQFAQAAINTMTQDGIGSAIKSLEDIGKGIAKSVKDDSAVARALNTYFAAKAVGMSPGDLLSRINGAVLNPNLELLFQGPSLRQFNYTFMMSAENSDETRNIKGIIKYFKQGMAIKRSENQLFLKSPNVFRIQYIKGGSNTEEIGEDDNHDGLNRIKTCALLNCSVDYTPEGNYSTYTDGSMTMYKVTLSFGELNPLYAEDYASAGPIGF